MGLFPHTFPSRQPAQLLKPKSTNGTPFLRPSNDSDIPQGKFLILAHKHCHGWPHFLSVPLSSISAPPPLCSLPPASFLEHAEHSQGLCTCCFLNPECVPQNQQACSFCSTVSSSEKLSLATLSSISFPPCHPLSLYPALLFCTALITA